MEKRKQLLYGSRDDAARARMFDSLMASEETSRALREMWLVRVAILAVRLGITEVEAKALLISYIALESMDPVERSFCIDRGNAIQREMEWKRVDYVPPYTL